MIICTRDRPASFRRALLSVLLQDTGGFEVIVVDGSEPPVAVPESPRAPVRVLSGQRGGEGAARTAGLRAARGALVAWCDDDDEWSPDHLRLLREALLAEPDLGLVYAASAPDGHLVRPDARALPPELSIPAGDVLHRAELARQAGAFDPSLPAFAAGDLWGRIGSVARTRRVDLELTRHHRVPGRITGEAAAAALERLRVAWEPVMRRAHESGERLRERERRGRVVPFDPDTWREGRRELLFQAQMKGWVSFPVVAKGLIRALERQGVRVTLGPRREGRLPPEWRSVLGSPEPQNRLGLILDSFTGPAGLRSERSAFMFMWESTLVRRHEIEEINRAASLLYVPSRESAQIARENGVSVPVRVLHHGIDPERTPWLERPRSGAEPYTFGTTATLTPRKGTDLLVRAFQEEFAPGEPVRLILRHTYHTYYGEMPDDPRIVLVTAFYQDDALREFLRSLDAFVFPSRGEGFGLPGLEAMATGLPVIATNWSGPVEYLDPADTYPLRYTMGRCADTPGGRDYLGSWAEPDLAHLRELMRYLYEHRAEAADAGRRASARVHRDWTWDRPARQLIADFDLLARGVTPV